MKRLGVCLVMLASVAWAQYPYSNPAKVIGSSHDFTVGSPANVKSTTGTDACTFCHTPHQANPGVPLWNHKLSQGVTYQVYQSSTVTSTMMQPTANDSSRLCLSCHDGTVALGDTVNNGLIPFQNASAEGAMPATSSANFGANLADHHPVVFVPNTAINNQVQLPPKGDAVQLDGQGKLQCTSCHDPHNEGLDRTEKRFLVKSNANSGICTTCHVLKGGTSPNLWSWNGIQGLASSHQQATNIYSPQTNGGVAWLGSHTGYTNINTNGCEACHRPHTAHNAERLLKGETDQVCFQCHDGNAITNLSNLKQEFSKMYIHPSLGPQAGHDPAEAPNNITSRHVACDDCHNAHAARPDSTQVTPPQLSRVLFGVSGITGTGAPHDPRHGSGDAQYEYEICFKCHGPSPNQPQQPGYTTYGPLPSRVLRTTDLSQAFGSPVSAHPVIRAGLGLSIPSLLPAVVDGNGMSTGRLLAATSQISCSDCHNNDSGRNLGTSFSGPEGPHGSNVPHILERSYLIETPTGAPGTTPNVPYVTSNYALCFKCHSESNLKGNTSWRGHNSHMTLASCATCHDAHGVPNGTIGSNASLINFDRNIVGPGSNGQLQYTRSGTFNGTCSLTCHSKDHKASTY